MLEETHGVLNIHYGMSREFRHKLNVARCFNYFFSFHEAAIHIKLRCMKKDSFHNLGMCLIGMLVYLLSIIGRNKNCFIIRKCVTENRF